MKVKVIMIPKTQLHTISLQASIREALEQIDQNNMLSLPVVEEGRFIGVLSKQFIYESFFKLLSCTRDEFLDKPVTEFMFTKLPEIRDTAPIDKAAEMFLSTQFRFIPVTNERDAFIGIVTQRAVFKEYQRLFGSGYHSITVFFYDYQGSLARIANIISKAGGNIKNSVIMNTDTMGLHEIFVRIECENIKQIMTNLEDEGYDVRC